MFYFVYGISEMIQRQDLEKNFNVNFRKLSLLANDISFLAEGVFSGSFLREKILNGKISEFLFRGEDDADVIRYDYGWVVLWYNWQ